ncbi:MAG: type II toxin-antitoxin system RelE/ParE family toxin [Pyrinomonadaceae bacterium]|nr:type II toxin-antitoxin system RelE/ParE family toxin [Pyrinomonadaceae bacterium]
MTYQIIVRPEAAREIQDAFDWYEEKSEGLGLEFLRAADACLAGIKRSPLASPIVHEQIRRALLRRFPYALFYLVQAESIIVLACFHVKRHPVDWMRRIQAKPGL